MARDEFVTLTDVRVRLHELIRDLEERNVLLLRHGKPVGVMVGYEAYNALLERVEELEDQVAVYEAEREDPGLNVPWRTVKAESGHLVAE